jgi:hypothetical protein
LLSLLSLPYKQRCVTEALLTARPSAIKTLVFLRDGFGARASAIGETLGSLSAEISV